MSQFEVAEKYARKCGNAANRDLASEAIQCLKVWTEKRQQQELEEATRMEQAHSASGLDTDKNSDDTVIPDKTAKTSIGSK